MERPEEIERAARKRQERFEDRLMWGGIVLVLALGGAWWWFSSDRSNVYSADEHLSRARGFTAEDNVRAGIIEYQNAIQLEPGNLDARAELGVLQLRLGALGAALKELRQARRLGDRTPGLTLSIVRALLGSRRYKEALVELEAPEVANPQYAIDTSLLAAQAWVGLGEPDRGRELYESVLATNPEVASAEIGLARIYLDRGNEAEGLRRIARAMEIDPTYAPAHMQRGQVALAQGQFDVAEASYAEAVRLDAWNVSARIGKARALVAQNALEAARDELHVLRKYAPGHTAVNFLRALVARRDFDNNRARSALSAVLRKNPEHYPSLLLLGSIQHESGELAAALSNLTRFVRAHPNHVYALRRLAGAQIELGLYEDAASKLVRVLEIEPRNLDVLSLLGQLYSEQSRYQLARDYFEQAVLLEPDDATLRTYLGMAELSVGDTERGISHLEVARAAAQDSLKSDVLLFFAKIKAGRTDDALVTARELVGERPYEAAFHNLLGIGLEATGDAKGAEVAYRKAFDLDSSDPAAALNLGRLKRFAGDSEGAKRRYAAVQEGTEPGSPPHVGATIALAELAEEEGNAELARQQYASVLEFEEGNVPAAMGLAGLAEGAGNSAEAKVVLELARARNPDALEPRLALIERYHRDKEWDALLPVAEEAQALIPRDPGVLRVLGEAYIRREALDKALGAYQQLVDVAPAVGDAHYRLGAVYVLKRELGTALGFFARALELDSKHIGARLGLGALSLTQQDISAAEGHLRRARQIGGDDHGTTVLEGDIHFAKGKLREAIRSYKRAETEKLSPAVVIKLHSAQRRVGKTDEALATLDAWLDKHPTSIPILELAARAAIEEDRSEEAIDYFEKILSLQPQHARTLNNLAWMHFDLGDDRALEFAQRAWRVDEENPDYLFTLGWMTVTLGEVDLGLQYLRQAVRARPDDSNLRLRFAETLIDQERPIEARKQIDILLTSQAPIEHLESARALLSRIVDAG
ncbi:MAG: XrtA/PEP-CTERM system TPR-repeat protein PrsT [Pseudomonadota bacterium]